MILKAVSLKIDGRLCLLCLTFRSTHQMTSLSTSPQQHLSNQTIQIDPMSLNQFVKIALPFLEEVFQVMPRIIQNFQLTITLNLSRKVNHFRKLNHSFSRYFLKSCDRCEEEERKSYLYQHLFILLPTTPILLIFREKHSQVVNSSPLTLLKTPQLFSHLLQLIPRLTSILFSFQR